MGKVDLEWELQKFLRMIMLTFKRVSRRSSRWALLETLWNPNGSGGEKRRSRRTRR